MLKVLYFTSEKKKKFGVFKVANSIFDIFFFKPQIIHIHGCWRPKLFIVFLLAKIASIKIVISPHGMIDPYSFSQKKIKKFFAWFFYQKYIFKFSNLIIVNSKLEKKNLIKKLKLSKRIEIIKH